jgi:lipid-binding SYLF domain-containing protein
LFTVSTDFKQFLWSIVMHIKSSMAAAGLAILGLLASTASVALTPAEIDASADGALKDFYTLNPTNRDLAGKAVGILIFGKVTKAGVGVAGEYGEGVLRVQGRTVDYYKLMSGSVGLTLGVAKHREIIMFMTQGALDKFTKSAGWSAGGETAIAVVSQGAGGTYDSATLGKPILGFVFSEKGLIGDLSLEGTKISKIKE